MRCFVRSFFVVTVALLATALAVSHGIDSALERASRIGDDEASSSCQLSEKVNARRHAAIDDWIAHRRTFDETVARFQELAAEDPFDVIAWLRPHYPGCTEQQLHERHVLIYAQGSPEISGAGNSVDERFRQELKELQERCEEGIRLAGK
jgi:hypothetical protein